MTTTPANLFAQSLSTDLENDVRTVNVPLARQAIDLHIATGGGLRWLLGSHRWFYYPVSILSLAFDGDDLERECRLHAIWCARTVLHLARPADRPTLEKTLETAERYARGKATAQEMQEAKAAAKATVYVTARASTVTAAKAAAAAKAAKAAAAAAAIGAIGAGAAAAAIGAADSYAADAAADASAYAADAAAIGAADAAAYARVAQQERLIQAVCAALLQPEAAFVTPA